MRIVARKHSSTISPSLVDYRCMPYLWREAGIVNSRGVIVCLDSEFPSVHADMKMSEPLYPPTTFTYNEDGEAVE